ncbi:hypothetical protein M1843_14375 [Isoptericola sp. 4D.3]|uniref:Uncharacterized protein n=1 Tax=Isoptericola peretonis TaxID=2918523 RepID=A0ABT0J6A0_9MICO|nr:hypothetical protein [Isoptericola sp. 4D.3]
MSGVWAVLPVLAAAPSPSPSPTQGPTELEVTPGLAGFVATFAVALACVLLFLSLTRHLRRARHNAEEQGLPIEEPKRVGPRHPGEDVPDAPGREPGTPAGDEGVDGAPGDETDGQGRR